MSLDANKTGLTHRVTAVAAAYLCDIGCKPVETEVQVSHGWIADVASYWYPSFTETKKLHLPKRLRERLGFEGNERQERHLMPRVYGHGPFTVLAEVKSSEADWIRERNRKWNSEMPAHLCFVAFPYGIGDESKIPDGWYGIETSADGTKVRKIHRHKGEMHAQHIGMVVEFIAAVGIRRDHRTRYSSTRDWLKSYRAADSEKKNLYSARRLLSAIVGWLQDSKWHRGLTLSQSMGSCGVRVDKLGRGSDEDIAYLESLKPGSSLVGETVGLGPTSGGFDSHIEQHQDIQR